VTAVNLLVNGVYNGQAVEATGESFPQLAAIPSLTRVVEAVYLLDACTLVVSTKQQEFGINCISWLLELERNVQDYCDGNVVLRDVLQCWLGEDAIEVLLQTVLLEAKVGYSLLRRELLKWCSTLSAAKQNAEARRFGQQLTKVAVQTGDISSSVTEAATPKIATAVAAAAVEACNHCRKNKSSRACAFQ